MRRPPRDEPTRDDVIAATEPTRARVREAEALCVAGRCACEVHGVEIAEGAPVAQGAAA